MGQVHISAALRSTCWWQSSASIPATSRKRKRMSTVGPHNQALQGGPRSPLFFSQVPRVLTSRDHSWLSAGLSSPWSQARCAGQVLGNNTYLAICTSEKAAMDAWGGTHDVQVCYHLLDLWLSFPPDNLLGLPKYAQGHFSFPAAPSTYTFEAWITSLNCTN